MYLMLRDKETLFLTKKLCKIEQIERSLNNFKIMIM